MAPGVSWIDRAPTDWLASNGRWYPNSQYPRGWTRSALPPAPGQTGGAESVMRRYAEDAERDGRGAYNRVKSDSASSSVGFQEGFENGNYEYVESPASPPPSPKPGFSVASTKRRVSNATVTSQRDYAAPVEGGPAPAGRLEAKTPPPPGRVRDDNAPAQGPPPPSFTPARRTSSAPDSSSEFEVIAGDLGKVLGGAKRRIEAAINEAAKQ